MKLAILFMLYAVCQVPPTALGENASLQADTVPSDPVRHWLRVESDWEPDAAAALAAARTRLEAALRRWLSAERPSLGEGFLSAEPLSHLLSNPAVLRRQSQERRERAYGTLWRARLEIGLHQAAIDDWTAGLRAQARRQRGWVWAKAGLSAIGLLLAGGLVRALDRRTHGYRRAAAVLAGGALAAIFMAAVWSY